MTDEEITAYLLEELTEEEAERFEEHCFAKEEWPADLDAAEQELIDAYLRNELSNDRRRRFETNYLTTDVRKARVLTAQSFHQVLCPELSPKVTIWAKFRTFWRRPLVPQTALAILVLAIGIWLLAPLFMQGRRLPQPSIVVELGLSSSDRSTGSPSKRVRLPLATDNLEVHLKLPEQSPETVSYRIQWEDFSGVLGDLQAQSRDGEYLVVLIPAAKLRPGQYAVKLFEIKRDGTEQRVSGGYFFTAEEDAPNR
ncbi:MAG TPA: hypothetical protein VKB02_03495 [Pyrinomonadaceae bacterium]|nr:hypothetical protein [Pyrinomonadaceae bacterium]